MKLGAKVKEKIARTMGEYFSTKGIVDIFTDAKISTDKSLYAKWRITLDAFSKIAEEDGICRIIEEFCHPLNFSDLQIRQNFIDALNKILLYEDCEIKSTDRTAKMVSVSEPKEEVKEETEKVKVLPDINKSSYSEKVIDLVAKVFCNALSPWEIKKAIEPIIQKNNDLYNQEEIKNYFEEIVFDEYPFYTFSETLQVVRKKDEKADTTIASIITKLLHPLNYNADEDLAENIATSINKYLKYIGKIVFYSEEEKEYSICKIGNLEDEEFFMIEEAQEDFEREQNELDFLRLPENKEKMSTLRKAYQTFINIVEVFCENPSKPSGEMNDAYVQTKKLIANAVRDLRLYVDTVDTKRIYILEHYFIPFNNLFTAEKEYTPDVTEVDLSGKKLNWDYIRPRMNATYGCIEDFYNEIEGSDVLSKPDVQQTLNGVSLLLSKIKEDNKKASKAKQKIITPKIPTQKIEITNMPELRVRNADDSAIVKNKKRIALPKFSSTSWSKVEIRFINEEVVYIKADKKTATVNYEGLGFNNDKTEKPNTAWRFLLELAKNGGETSEIKSPVPDNIKQHKKTVSDRLKSVFKNDTDPFYDFNETNTYKIKIKLIPPINEDQNDKLGIKEYIEETMTSKYEPEK